MAAKMQQKTVLFLNILTIIVVAFGVKRCHSTTAPSLESSRYEMNI